MILRQCSYLSEAGRRRRRYGPRVDRAAEVSGHVSKRMDSGVYMLRRKVIEYVYRAKKLLGTIGVNMPRVDVRITEASSEEVRKRGVLGLALIKGRFIWIPEDTLAMGDAVIHETTFHELLHALYGVPHITGCPLMSAKKIEAWMPAMRIDNIFLKHAREWVKK